MYSNIGGKIKAMAAVYAVIGIIASIATGILLISNDLASIGVPVLIVGPLLFWVSSFMVYGFGQLIENSDLIASQFRKQQKKAEKQAAKKHIEQMLIDLQDNSVDESEYMDFRCPLCGETVSYTKGDIRGNETLACPNCSRRFYTKSIFNI